MKTSTTSTQNVSTANAAAPFNHSGERSKNCLNAATADLFVGLAVVGTKPVSTSSRQATIDSRTTPNEAASSRQLTHFCKCASNSRDSLTFISLYRNAIKSDERSQTGEFVLLVILVSAFKLLQPHLQLLERRIKARLYRA